MRWWLFGFAIGAASVWIYADSGILHSLWMALSGLVLAVGIRGLVRETRGQ